MKTKILLLVLVSVFASSIVWGQTNTTVPLYSNLQTHYLLQYWEMDYHCDWSDQDKQIYALLKERNQWYDGDGDRDRGTIDAIYKQKPELRTKNSLAYEDFSGLLPVHDDHPIKITLTKREKQKLARDWKKKNPITRAYRKELNRAYAQYDSAYTAYLKNPYIIVQDSVWQAVFISNLKTAKSSIDWLYATSFKTSYGKLYLEFVYYYITSMVYLINKTDPNLDEHRLKETLNVIYINTDSTIRFAKEGI
jgi:hypothetical protein